MVLVYRGDELLAVSDFGRGTVTRIGRVGGGPEEYRFPGRLDPMAADSAGAATDAPTAPTRVRWLILALLVAASFVAYLLRINFSIAGDAIRNDLGLDKVQLGRVLAAFAWGYALFQFPGGIFGDRLGSRRTLAVIALAWGGLTLAIGFLPKGLAPATILTALILLRVLMGVAQAPFFPVTSGGTISHWFPPSGWALPNGLITTGMTLGAAAAGPIVVSLTAALGWRLGFVVLAPTGLVLALVWWLAARDRPGQHRWVNEAELNLIAAHRPKTERRPPVPWHTIIRNRDLMLLTVSYFCMNYVFYIFFNWFYIYLLEVRGFAALEGGFIAAVPWLTGALFATLGGLWCDRLSKRLGPRWGCRIPALTGLPLAAAFLVFGAMAPNALVAVVLLSLCFACTQLTDAAYWAATIAVADGNASAAAGMLNTGGNAVGGFGALLVPYMAQTIGWVPALATGSVFAIVGAVLWLFIRADRPLGTKG